VFLGSARQEEVHLLEAPEDVKRYRQAYLDQARAQPRARAADTDGRVGGSAINRKVMWWRTVTG
jgi:hypothetical protein